MATKPRFDAVEFKKLKDRETDRVSSLARSNASWVSSMMLYRELFNLPTSVHPYSRFDTTAKEVSAITLADCKAWHKREFTGKNALLVVVGDVDGARVKAEAERALGAWAGEKPEQPVFAPPVLPQQEFTVYLVDRPASPQESSASRRLGPERTSPSGPRCERRIRSSAAASRAGSSSTCARSARSPIARARQWTRSHMVRFQ